MSCVYLTLRAKSSIQLRNISVGLYLNELMNKYIHCDKKKEILRNNNFFQVEISQSIVG